MKRLLDLVTGLCPMFQNDKPDPAASGGKADAGGSGDPDPNLENPEGGEKKTVSYDTYSKTVKEAKAAKARAKELEDKLAGAENDRLGAEGKKDELIAKLKSDNEKLTKTQKENLNSFVFSSLDNQVREVATSLGCVDVDAVGKLIDLTDIEVDTKTFKADKTELTQALQQLKKDKPYLFNKVAPKINGKMPSGAKLDTGGKPISELTTAEIKARLTAMKT